MVLDERPGPATIRLYTEPAPAILQAPATPWKNSPVSARQDLGFDDRCHEIHASAIARPLYQGAARGGDGIAQTRSMPQQLFQCPFQVPFKAAERRHLAQPVQADFLSQQPHNRRKPLLAYSNCLLLCHSQHALGILNFLCFERSGRETNFHRRPAHAKNIPDSFGVRYRPSFGFTHRNNSNECGIAARPSRQKSLHSRINVVSKR